MSKKKKLIITAAAAFVLLLAVGVTVWCLMRGKWGEHITKAENHYETNYHSYCTYEHDADMKIDAKLDEAVWQDKKWYTNTYLDNLDGTKPVIRVTGFPTEKGVYIASVVNDTNLMDNGERAPLANSNWEFRVTADNVGEERSSSALYCMSYNIDMKGENFGINPNFDRAVRVEGEVNSGNTTSATLEMFIPWESLQVDTSLGIPESFRVRPSYRAVLPGVNGNWPINLNADAGQTKDFYTFTKVGYVNADREGAVLGDSAVGYAKSANWDVSREAEGIVQSSPGEEWHQIYFTGEYGANYILETKLRYIKPLNNDWPKAAFLFRGTDSTWYLAGVNLNGQVVTKGNDGKMEVNKLEIGTVGQEWNWRAFSQYSTINPNPTGDIKLTVLKYGKNFYYFINDQYVTSEVIETMDKKVLPGICSLGADVIYKDYSCKELTEDTLKQYLNKKNLYSVDVSVKGEGGEVRCSTLAVEKGGSYAFSIVTKPGYILDSLLINGKERIEDARKNASGSMYTVSNVTQNQKVVLSYKKFEGSAFKGKVTLLGATKNATVFMTLTNEDNETLYYETYCNGEFSIVIPDGRYKVYVAAEGHRNEVFQINKKGNMTRDISLSPSSFPATVDLDGSNVQWGLNVWDLTHEDENRVSTSFEAGGKMVPIYFEETAKDFVVESTIDYTTDFTGDASLYQPDLMGGFSFAGKNKSGWVVARTNGIVFQNRDSQNKDFWDYRGGLWAYDLLAYPTKKSITFAVAKVGNDAYLYCNGKEVQRMAWTELSGGLGANEKVAVGLMMIADRTANIQFSNYSLQTGTAAASLYIAQHKGEENTPLNENPMFAEKVTVGGKTLMSRLGTWNIDNVGNNVVSTSFAAGGKGAPFYFSAKGKDALLHATVEYTTSFTGSESEYQSDLMGGFCFHDGKQEGWIVACDTGFVSTNWQYHMGFLEDPILRYPTKRKVDVTMAVKGNYIYIYYNGRFASKVTKKSIVPTASTNTELAYGLYMIADKTADIRFSNISISTDAGTVDRYIRQHR